MTNEETIKILSSEEVRKALVTHFECNTCGEKDDSLCPYYKMDGSSDICKGKLLFDLYKLYKSGQLHFV